MISIHKEYQKRMIMTDEETLDSNYEMSKQEKIICLGKEFNSEEERREYYRNELRTKLPELKNIEGFPIGEDEDIINLSDPPFYTACPNPWLNDFIAEWEKEKENIKGRFDEFYVEEPYATDVSEGKKNPIYGMHTYHTKVPHPAIMRYILHYTQPGDIILDGVAGTGMTAVAAQICDNPEAVLKYKIESDFKNLSLKPPIWGKRKSINGDLSPIASFIAYNYNLPIDSLNYTNEIESKLNNVKEEFGWMYETEHNNGQIGIINYVVWSEVFLCPICNKDVIYYEHSVNEEKGTVSSDFKCKHCNSELSKRKLNKKTKTYFDEPLSKTISISTYQAVLINYQINEKEYEKKPDDNDLEKLAKIDSYKINTWFPVDEIIKGDKTSDPFRVGITHIHQYFDKRTLIILSKIFELFSDNPFLKFTFTGSILGLTRMQRYRPNSGFPNMLLSGTLYIGSLHREWNAFNWFMGKKKALAKAKTNFKGDLHSYSIYTGSATKTDLNPNTIDYIFTDPPFGSNLMYSELNTIWEAWLKVLTNNKEEAIENKTQRKSSFEYQFLMTQIFQEYYRVLKPGKWMTVEFSNTSAIIWNGIQTAIQRAGFIIANVSALDKKQGSFKALNNAVSVKEDLVISCYKPTIHFDHKFKIAKGEIAIWDFIDEHLRHLPIHLKSGNSTTAVIERNPKILYDRVISFYLMRGLPIPLDAKDFQEGLKQRFIEKDGMYFTTEQAAEYDEKKAKSPNFVQLSLIVTNESDAIEWLKDRLRKQAQKYQDIMPDFRIATQSLRKGDTLPELQIILEQNFYQESDGNWHVPDLTQAKVREAIRNKALLKEFNAYVTAISQPKAKKLKEVRVEALRAGFKNSWEQKDFKTIVTLGDLIPQNILLEDEQLLMYYDIAKDRI
jgi:DNA modification methylase